MVNDKGILTSLFLRAPIFMQRTASVVYWSEILATDPEVRV
jgi:hypothetical protein